jgi:transposase
MEVILMTLRVRTMTEDERARIEGLAHTRTAPTGIVRRAQIIWAASQGQCIPQIAARLGVSEKMARHWLKRFNDLGIPGLEEAPRSGRPATYQAEHIRVIIASAQSDPKALGQPFSSWTLDRLVHYLQEVKGIPIKRSRLYEIFQAEGLTWL